MRYLHIFGLSALVILHTSVGQAFTRASEYAVNTFVNHCMKHSSNKLTMLELNKQKEWRILKSDKNETGVTHHYWNIANGRNLRPRTGSTVIVLQFSRTDERCSVGVYNITLASILSSLRRRKAKVSELMRDQLGYSASFSIQEQDKESVGELFTRADRWWFLMLNRM